jgi:hypothetical protein
MTTIIFHNFKGLCYELLNKNEKSAAFTKMAHILKV